MSGTLFSRGRIHFSTHEEKQRIYCFFNFSISHIYFYPKHPLNFPFFSCVTKIQERANFCYLLFVIRDEQIRLQRGWWQAGKLKINLQFWNRTLLIRNWQCWNIFLKAFMKLESFFIAVVEIFGRDPVMRSFETLYWKMRSCGESDDQPRCGCTSTRPALRGPPRSYHD